MPGRCEKLIAPHFPLIQVYIPVWIWGSDVHITLHSILNHFLESLCLFLVQLRQMLRFNVPFLIQENVKVLPLHKRWR